MATVQTLGALAELDRPNWNPGVSRTSLSFYDEYNYDYAEIYRTQPNVRTCVDFLARNIAQLGVHVFRRVSDTDRERLRDHGLAKLLKLPLPAVMKMTRYRLIEALVSDLGIYFNAYWLKLRVDSSLTGLLRIPPIYMTPHGGLVPTEYHMEVGGRHRVFEPNEIVHFRGYNPENAVSGLAPLETLRRVLAEEASAGQYREEFWENSARVSGFVKRPKDAPEWSPTARARFLAEFNALYAGGGSSGAGTAVLEEGMEWQAGSYNPQESEYVAGRKLTREECARSFHIPLPMVGILDHATFSNISEQHKNLYQDSLGPWLVSIEQDIELQVLPEFEDNANIYLEFNIADKLAGSFEDQIKALQTAIGRPWMTANEGRARQNMPSRPDGDELAVPLNVTVGEPPAPEPPPEPPVDGGEEDPAAIEAAAARLGGSKKFNSHAPKLRARYLEQWSRALAKHFRRQESAIVSRVPKAAKATIGGVWFDEARWNSELAADLFGLNIATSKAWAQHTIDQAGIEIDDPEAFDEIMLPWLSEHSRVQAEGINGKVRDGLADALNDPDPLEAVKGLFDVAITAWAINEAISAVTSAANFGSHEAANAGGLSTKTWRVNSGNPRPSHAALNGTTIGIREKFATGQRWPGDPAGGAEENANCECSVEFN